MIRCLSLLVFLLISCKALAFYAVDFATDHQQFDEDAKRVEQIKDTNLQQAYNLLTRYQSQLAQLSLTQQLQYYKLLSDVYLELNKYQQAKDTATQGLLVSKQLKTPTPLVSELFYNRGFAFESLGEKKLATQDYLNGLDIAESLQNKLYVAQGLINLGALYYQQDQYDRSLLMFNDALKIAMKLNDDELKGYIYTELGILYGYMGEDKKSLQFYQKSYQHYKKANKQLYALNALANMGMYYLDNDEYEQAINVFNEILAAPTAILNDQFYYTAYSGLAWAYNNKTPAEPEVAYQYHIIAGQYLPHLQQANIPFYYLIDKAHILTSLKQYQDVLDTLYQAEKLLTPEQIQQYDWNYLTIINLRAETLYTMGRYESAYQLQSEYINQVLAYHQRSNMKEVQSIRLKFESEQADLQRQLLEKQRSLQAVQLDKLQQEQQQQRWLITGGIVSLITLAWLFYGLHKGQKHLKRKARTDSLTGVANRRRIMQLGELTFSHAKSTQQPISVLMLDVDHFKHINDQYGHKVGDAVLVELVGIIGTVLRDNDHVGRFGGEEFIIVLPETNHTQALAIAERIRQVIEHFNWAGIGVSAVTVSIGIASNERSEYKHFSALLAHADAMLYQAKSEGRNRVCL